MGGMRVNNSIAIIFVVYSIIVYVIKIVSSQSEIVAKSVYITNAKECNQ